MYLKRPAMTIALLLGLMLVVWGALNTLIGQAYAQGGAGVSKEQAGIERNRLRPATAGPHVASFGNGNFEGGPYNSWDEYSLQGWPIAVSSTTLSTVGVTPHGGNWAAWLGGDDDETASISQTVTIPASDPTLSFWEWIGSEDVCGYDFGSVRIDDTEVISFDLCLDTNTGGWVESTLDLSAYAGQTVELQFRVTTDSISDPSSLFIDDVTLAGQTSGYSVYLPIVGKNSCSGYEYFDGFGDSNSGWYPGIDGKVTHKYNGGEYQLRLDDWNLDWLVTPNLAIPSSNYRVEADMRNAWVNPGTYGLVFGVHWYQASDNNWYVDQLYQVMINPNHQEYFVNKTAGGSWPTLRNWTYSGAIHAGDATNHLRVDRVGTSIRIYINGTAMPALTDTSYTGSGRDAGITAHSYNDQPVDMRFDNFHASTCVQ